MTVAEREECLEGKADGAPQWAAGVQHQEGGKRSGQLVCISPPRTLAGTLTSSPLVFLNPPRRSSPHSAARTVFLKCSSDHTAAPLQSHGNSVLPSEPPPSSCPGSRPHQLYFLSLPFTLAKLTWSLTSHEVCPELSCSVPGLSRLPEPPLLSKYNLEK